MLLTFKEDQRSINPARVAWLAISIFSQSQTPQLPFHITLLLHESILFNAPYTIPTSPKCAPLWKRSVVTAARSLGWSTNNRCMTAPRSKRRRTALPEKLGGVARSMNIRQQMRLMSVPFKLVAQIVPISRPRDSGPLLDDIVIIVWDGRTRKERSLRLRLRHIRKGDFEKQIRDYNDMVEVHICSAKTSLGVNLLSPASNRQSLL